MLQPLVKLWRNYQVIIIIFTQIIIIAGGYFIGPGVGHLVVLYVVLFWSVIYDAEKNRKKHKK